VDLTEIAADIAATMAPNQAPRRSHAIAAQWRDARPSDWTKRVATRGRRTGRI